MKFLIPIFLTIICFNNKAISNNNNYYIGDWTITKFISPKIIHGPELKYISDKEAKEFITKKIILTANFSNIFGNKLNSPNYVIRTENAWDYITGNYKVLIEKNEKASSTGVSPNTLNIKSKNIDVFDLEINNVYYEFFIIDKDNMVLACRGKFFFLRRG
jgi:hypothetical protein